MQWVVRPMTDEHHDYRGYAGEVASGAFKVGDEVVVLLGHETRIAGIDTMDGSSRRRSAALVGRSRDDVTCRVGQICRATGRSRPDGMDGVLDGRARPWPAGRWIAHHPHGWPRPTGVLPHRREHPPSRRGGQRPGQRDRAAAAATFIASSWTSTAAIASPAASSSSTSRRTTPQKRAWFLEPSA